MKKILIKQNCKIAPYRDRQLEVIRNNKKIIVSDGSVKEKDKIYLEDNLASKIVNTIFGDKAIAEYIDETEIVSEDEEETKGEVETPKTNNTPRKGKSKSK